MKHVPEHHTPDLRDIELVDEDLKPIAGGGDYVPVARIEPRIGQPIRDPSTRVQPELTLKDPTIRPVGNTGGGVNRGFPAGNPLVEDGIKVTVSWSKN